MDLIHIYYMLCFLSANSSEMETYRFVQILCVTHTKSLCALFFVHDVHTIRGLSEVAFFRTLITQYVLTIAVRISFKVAVNTIVPRSPFFLFLYLKTQTVTHIRKNAVEYLRQWNGAICVIYN